MYERILVALKRDEGDAALLKHAAGLAHVTGGRLILVHAVHSHSRDAKVFLREGAETYLAARAVSLRQEGIGVRTMVVDGPAASVVCHAAAAEEADLVIMGSHGHREVRHVLVGSVTESVVRRGVSPVLLLRP